MFRKSIVAFCVCLISRAIVAQNLDVSSILQEVEKNNTELKAYASLIESKQLELKSTNNLPDPEVGAYYLPFGEHSTGDYTEFQITQSFEFPTVYSARKGLIEQEKKQMEMEFVRKKQDVLLPALKYCNEIISLNQRLRINNDRVEQAHKIFEQVKQSYEAEQVGILEFNKAKLVWMQEQFSTQKLEVEKQNLLLLLKNLNGGNELTLDQESFSPTFALDSLSSIWADKQSNDPELQILVQQEAIALQQVNLSKKNSLPNITAGFNHQGVSGEYYSGIYGGVSIPLWSNKNKVKASEAHYEYQQTFTDVQQKNVYASFEKQYNEYQLSYQRFKEYQNTLTGLNSEALLFQAYELGEISFMEYYMELKFYREAIDTQIEIELQLSQLKAELLKHQL